MGAARRASHGLPVGRHRQLIRSLFPAKTVVGVPATTLAWGGGGVHCITRQIPARR
ncbi:agmatine deiminase family protein [Streptomyces sp. NPDC002520]